MPPLLLHALPLVLAAAGPAQAVDELPKQGAAVVPPRLVVICAVDQLASWVLEAGLAHCREDGGFRQLLARGVSFDRCAYSHGCTETGPGHATIGTGLPARLHGIVRNEWFQSDLGGLVYCVGDGRVAPVPGFPEGFGRSAARLVAPTIGDQLKRQFGDGARVASVAIKDRSAILMGGRSADAVLWFETSTGRFVTNSSWGEVAPEWLLALDEQKPADAFFGWRWGRFGPEEAYRGLEDDRPFERQHMSSGKRSLPVRMTGGKDGPERAFYLQLYESPVANELVITAALAALSGEKLGQDDVPDLLCLSFSANDTVGHTFGPESVEARDTLLRLDEQLGRLLAVLDERVGAGRYAFLLSADHGVAPSPEMARARGKDAGRGIFHLRAKSAANAALREHFAQPGGFVLQSSEQALFLDHALLLAAAAARATAAGREPGGIDAEQVLAEACKLAAAAVTGVPGIEQAFVVSELLQEGPGDDPMRRVLWNALYESRAGDIVMVFRPYWIEAPVAASHGSPHLYDRAVPLICMGPGLAAGHRSDAAVSPGLCAVLAAELLRLPPLVGADDRIPPDAMAR